MQSYITSKAFKGKASRIHGKGLFASKLIKPGEIVAVKDGHLVGIKEKHVLQKKLGQSFLQITDDLFIGPKTKNEIDKSFIYYNHSCNPNMGVQGQIVFVAMRDIKPGEEITVDYATTENDIYSFKCACGSKDCRRTVTGTDWQKKNLQKKYRGYFSWYLERKIKK